MSLASIMSLSIVLLIVIDQLHVITSHTISAIPKMNSGPQPSVSNRQSGPAIAPSLRGNIISLPKPELPQSDGPRSPNPHEQSANDLLSTRTGIPFSQSDDPVAPPELINLGHTSYSVPPCATVLTSSNCILQIPGDSIYKDIQDRRFVFAVGLIKDQCSLTVEDCLGSYSTFTNYLHFSAGNICNTVASVCCECNGCNRPDFPLYENSCAIMFEHEKCSLCYGFRLEVVKGDEIAYMNAFVDNRVSSIYVVPGCELKIFQDPSFQGLGALAQGSLDSLPSEWNDAISSFTCHCDSNDDVKSTTIVPTIPTASTTQIPIGVSTSTTEKLVTSTESQSSTTSDGQEHTPSTEMPETTTTTMKSTTIGSEEISTTLHTFTTTSKPLTSTTEMVPDTTTIREPDTTTRVPDTTTTGVPTTVFDDSNSVY